MVSRREIVIFWPCDAWPTNSNCTGSSRGNLNHSHWAYLISSAAGVLIFRNEEAIQISDLRQIFDAFWMHVGCMVKRPTHRERPEATVCHWSFKTLRLSFPRCKNYTGETVSTPSTSLHSCLNRSLRVLSRWLHLTMVSFDKLLEKDWVW